MSHIVWYSENMDNMELILEDVHKNMKFGADADIYDEILMIVM